MNLLLNLASIPKLSYQLSLLQTEIKEIPLKGLTMISMICCFYDAACVSIKQGFLNNCATSHVTNAGQDS